MAFGSFRVLAVLLGILISETVMANKPSSGSSLNGETINKNLTFQNGQLNLPALNMISEIEVGQRIISKEQSIVVKAVKFATPIKGAVGAPSPINGIAGPILMQYPINFRSTSIPLLGTVSGGSLYADYKDTISGSPGAFSSFYVPDNPNDSHYICSANLRTIFACDRLEAKAGQTYTIVETIMPASVGFRRELIYKEGDGKSITIIYREFSGSNARLSTTQELNYDISEGRVIETWGAIIEVINASNSGLKYKVVRHLQ